MGWAARLLGWRWSVLGYHLGTAEEVDVLTESWWGMRSEGGWHHLLFNVLNLVHEYAVWVVVSHSFNVHKLRLWERTTLIDFHLWHYSIQRFLVMLHDLEAGLERLEVLCLFWTIQVLNTNQEISICGVYALSFKLEALWCVGLEWIWWDLAWVIIGLVLSSHLLALTLVLSVAHLSPEIHPSYSLS